ncbi:DUF4430 domain-containing protein [Patescibacteria group bacterium]|nr:DUF4430 domain-containing protein [Patescibacteria group bacterium]MBU1500490.1 DUF4430 domain-containing protein [Patescibacteria group bacterium]MBU2080712.1 DUF4430 domain-containing protein [Patescibacteria group bacterium]MBU2123817.1 DUF4430 domain-containing protein [Patescibacteria group bacterium]MBU2194892.1 DUF4430 domain-containing protein [Patescibacteria group bacterium]
MYRKWTLIVAGILAIASTALILFSSYERAVELSPSQDVSEEVSNEIPLRQESVAEEVAPAIPARTHVLIADTAGTVESSMQKEYERGSLVYTSTSYPTLGSFLESINGLKNENGFYWMLYINGSSASVGMSQAYVVPGDLIEWRYE